jgi:hypothetical protein
VEFASELFDRLHATPGGVGVRAGSTIAALASAGAAQSFHPPAVDEPTFAEELADRVPAEVAGEVADLHAAHHRAEARHLASVALAEVLRRAASEHPLCALLARGLGITNETLPDIARRFGVSKQAVHLRDLKLRRDLGRARRFPQT